MRMHAEQQKKKKIAAIAIGLVKKGSVVFLDCGSTVQYLAELLPSIKGITVATNGVEALHYLSQHQVKTISTGGTVNPDNNAALIGERVGEFWRTSRADVGFFSTQALDGNGNIFVNQEAELTSIRAMLPSCTLKVLLCDSTKVGKIATFMLGTLREVDIVISDKDISLKYKKKFPGTTFLHP
jgi:DeoR/GlpR family transcriptional regulator of sugar metabolism